MGFGKIKIDSKRYWTALVLLAAVLLIGAFHSIYLIGVFLTIIFIAASKETLNLFKVENNNEIWFALILVWCAAIVYPIPIEALFAAIILFASISAFSQRDLKMVIPLIYPAAPLLMIFALYAEYGIGALVWLLFIVASCDTAAYFAGKSIGKTPFSASSPNKTMEGVAGGVTGAAIIGSIAGFFAMPHSIAQIACATILAAIASVFGDLFESRLKRLAGVKDSGDILPGHGGALDRIDGYLFAGAVLLIALHLYANG